MPNFTLDQLREAQYKTDQIRNMSVIAHVDHGKSTLTDSLVAKAGFIAEDAAGNTRLCDTDQKEIDRGITIKSTGISMYFESDVMTEAQKLGYIINLIDSPGHVDFSSEVTAALRVTDGALVVVDYVEGVSVQTETVLRQALQEKVKPVLMINKIDRGIFELKVDGEEMYQQFIRVIEDVNVIISNYETEDTKLQVDPKEGNVCFGSALYGWGFSITTFAKIYSKKFGVTKEKMMEKLWGDNYYDAKASKWKNHSEADDGNSLKRCFVQFVMNPIIKLCRAAKNNELESVQKMSKNLDITLKNDELKLEGKHLMKCVFQKWINAADALLEMIISKLPSPVEAQRYRMEHLYEGPTDDQTALAIRDCNKDGPVAMFISKMIPDDGRFYAFGRVFSGTVKAGQKVRIQGPNFVQGSKVDLHVKNVQRVVVMMAGQFEGVPEVPCGNTCALVGVDNFLVKQGTIATAEDAHNIKVMKYSVSPVVRVAVSVKDPRDLPKFVEGLKKLAKSDPLVQCIQEESGENVIAGCGELHVEICLENLETQFAKVPIVKGDPIVTYKETMTDTSDRLCLSKSRNNHNRLFCRGSTLSEELSLAIEEGEIGPRVDPKERVKILGDQFDWDRTDAQKIWCFGPDANGSNCIVDTAKGVQYLNEIKDSVTAAFQWASKEGVLCDENMRGCRFNIEDCKVHPDSAHRRGDQIMPMTRRVMYACELTAKPTLQEPVYLVEIQTPDDCVGAIYQIVSQRGGVVKEETPVIGTPLVNFKCYLPVRESFGFSNKLRQDTSGRAFPQLVFDHWAQINDDPLVADTKSNKIVEAIRKRKGLKPGIPSLDNFLDKIQ